MQSYSNSVVFIALQLFMCVLLNLQKEILLNDIETDRVFSNITAVYNANCEFWAQHVSTMLKHSRKTREPLNPSHLKDGFSKVQSVYMCTIFLRKVEVIFLHMPLVDLLLRLLLILQQILLYESHFSSFV